jgi:hypothetical protein
MLAPSARDASFCMQFMEVGPSALSEWSLAGVLEAVEAHALPDRPTVVAHRHDQRLSWFRA